MNSARAFAIVALALFIGVSQSTIAASKSRDEAALRHGDYWAMWMRATHRQCLGNQLQWVGLSDDALDLVNGFLFTLSPSDLEKIQSIADDRCREEIGGFTCYLAVHVDGFKRLGLLKRFARFGCEHYDCHDDGLCKSIPAGR
jgi:hypothetical protein